MLNGNHKPRVVIDTLSARCGGGETYLRNLLQHSQDNGCSEILVLTSDPSRTPLANGKIRSIKVSRFLRNPLLRAIWARVALRRFLRKFEADVFFSPGGVLLVQPPKGCRTVVMFRNMLPFDTRQRRKFPLGVERVRLWALRRALLQSMKKADLVIFVSEFGKKVIEAESRGQLKGTIVIPHGVSKFFRATAEEKRISRLKTPVGPYLLYVSSLVPYKAQVEVIRGYALLKKRRRTREKLLLAGLDLPSYAAKIRREVSKLGLSDDVAFLGAVPYEELPSLYQRAVINIFASECENCPNVLLEAMAAGRPVVCSNRPPMSEFAAAAALYFDPSCPEDLAEKLLWLLERPDLMDAFGCRAREHSLLFDWGKTADFTWRAITDLAHEEKSEKGA